MKKTIIKEGKNNTRNGNNNRDWPNQFVVASLRLTNPAGHSLGTEIRWESASWPSWAS